MLGMPEPTPYDLRFRFLGIPVRVHPSFWLVAALLGSVDDRGFNPQSTLLWVACVFVSILVHEYGHGLMSRIFRCSPAIALYGMGGVCYSEAERQSPWQRLAVLISGPGAGFLLLFLIIGGWYVLGRSELNLLGKQILGEMFRINLYWSLLNLFPIWPLDGGQIAGVVLSMINRRKGTGWAHVVSLLTAGILALLAFQQENFFFLGIFFAYFAVINFQVLQSLHHAAKYGSVEDDADWWRR
ncbi:MAG TPA: site-2 protease family protein [Isosphaeraceae bacterium]|nr:site-2 protease family protein [Isosphaeraceae bacterium]